MHQSIGSQIFRQSKRHASSCSWQYMAQPFMLPFLCHNRHHPLFKDHKIHAQSCSTWPGRFLEIRQILNHPSQDTACLLHFLMKILPLFVSKILFSSCNSLSTIPNQFFRKVTSTLHPDVAQQLQGGKPPSTTQQHSLQPHSGGFSRYYNCITV